VTKEKSMKKSVVILIAVPTFLVALTVGFMLGANRAVESSQVRDNYLSVINAAAAYSAHAEIVEMLNAQKPAKAVCLLSLQASAEVNQVRACLEAENCKRLVEDKVREIAPELLANGPLRVTYYREGDLCKP
jgi:flagellar basal body-associated protein FliL